MKTVIFYLVYFLKCLIPICSTLYVKLTRKRHKISKHLAGKTALVTGGNEGIGYEVCLNLASRGCSVIIADKNETSKSIKKIVRETGNPNVVGKLLNLASFQSVRQFAKDINENVKKLDILINNAGISHCKKDESTEDGLNPVMQVNFFGHFLLTHLLLDLLQRSGSSKILFASSGLNELENIDLNNLNKHSYQENYADSKMALLIASDYFAEKLKHTSVTSNAYHPGICLTRLYDHNVSDNGPLHKFSLNFIIFLDYLMGTAAWEIAENIVSFAVSDEFEKDTGVYFYEDRKYFKPLKAKNVKFTKALMKASETIVKII